MTAPHIETEEQFFALLLAQQASYHVGTNERWPFGERMPGGWEAIYTAADLADAQWREKGTYFSKEDRSQSVFTRFKALRDTRHPQPQGGRAIGFSELMGRFSGTMSEDLIYSTALQIVQDWLRGG